MLQAKVLQLIDNVQGGIDQVLRACVRYCCRLCGAAGITQLLRIPGLSPRQRDGVRALKEWLDYSTYRNELYRALWRLCGYRRPQYRATARLTGLDPIELRRAHRLLDPEDRAAIVSTPEPQVFLHAHILRVLQALQQHTRRLVKHRLRYCYQNDAGLSQEDFWAELQVQAMRIIRNYEVLGLTPDEMIPLVAQGLTNHVKNLATYHGKDRRNPLQRIEHKTTNHTTWYCNVNAEIVEHVSIYTEPEYRRGDYCLATFRSRPQAYVHTGRLHDTQEQATVALHQYQHGRATKRAIVVDLTASKQDDWQPTKMSLETPGSEDGAPLINFLPSSDPEPPAELLADSVIKTITDPRARMFFEVIQGDLAPLFDPYCFATTGREAAELPTLTLGRVARKYCGLSLKELTALVPML